MSDGAPRIDVPASATPEQAAALVVAVEQFLRDTTVAVVEEPSTSAWGRAALVEGVGRADAWGGGGDDLAAWAS